MHPPIEVFCSYAHKDEPQLQKLETHLNVLKRQGLISTWHDRHIVPGMDWAYAIDTHLSTASVILLLISPDFLASDYCYGIELQRALERHRANEARVIPILLRPVDWKGAPFAHLQMLPTDARPITTWRNRDEAFADVAAGVRRAIEDLTLLSASASRAVLPSIWSIPYPRNSFFIGREDILLQLRAQLQAGQATALSQLQAIIGLGGVGKTQIAIEYAYRFHQDYEAVLWARADSPEALVSSYVALAILLNLPEQDAQDQRIIVQAVKNWLQTHQKWLLILDSADELDLLPPFLPPAPGGHLILTTRASAPGHLASRIIVDVLPSEQGALFLLRRAVQLAPDAELSQASPKDRDLALQITHQLGRLPLALDQAGAYLEATGYSLSMYQQIYQQHRAELLKERRALIPDHPEPVATTWSLSFSRVEQRSPAAAELLRLCAYLSPDAIAEEVILQGAASLGPLLAPVAADPFLLGQAIDVLRAYSLVGHDPAARTLSIHRLVQVVLRDSLSDEIGKEWTYRAVSMLNTAFPYVEFVQWRACERCVPHALLCATWIEQARIAFPAAARLFNQAAYYLTIRARYAEAEPLYLHAIMIDEMVFGVEHPTLATDLNNLAALYVTQGKYAQAEPLLLRALEVYEQQLGSEHPNTAVSLNNLAHFYEEQGKYQQAEPLLLRALAIYEQQRGPVHPDTASALNNLAVLYEEQGKYQQAEPLLLRALEVCERQLGSEHPDTAQSLDNLAVFYARSQGKYTQAEPLLLRALAIREQQMGPSHPDTAHCLNNLAALYAAQRKYAQAEPLYERALSIREQQLGPEHPDTASSLNNLAELYKKQEKYEQAEPLLKQALATRERQLGSEHPDTAQSLNNLAGLYYSQGEYAQAEPLLKQALATRERQLGSEHPDIAQSLNNLAALYAAQGKYAQAEPLYERALATCERQLGPEHLDTAQSLNNLAILYEEQGRYKQAKRLYERTLAIYEQQLGPEHLDTLTVRENLASLLRSMRRGRRSARKA